MVGGGARVSVQSTDDVRQLLSAAVGRDVAPEEALERFAAVLGMTPEELTAQIKEESPVIGSQQNRDRLFQHFIRVPTVVEEALDLCTQVKRLRFKADDLQVRFSRIVDQLETEASAEPPVVRVGSAANLWQFLQTAQERVAQKHSALQSSLVLSQTNAARCKTLDRQRVSWWVSGVVPWLAVSVGSHTRVCLFHVVSTLVYGCSNVHL